VPALRPGDVVFAAAAFGARRPNKVAWPRLEAAPTFLTGIAMPFGEKIVRFIFASRFSVARRV
jgi:hypothetical protein